MRSIIEYIEKWEKRCYKDGIPDEVPKEIHNLDNVPSYKKIALDILNNNFDKYNKKKKKSYWYNELKRKELRERGVLKNEQIKLEL